MPTNTCQLTQGPNESVFLCILYLAYKLPENFLKFFSSSLSLFGSCSFQGWNNYIILFRMNWFKLCSTERHSKSIRFWLFVHINNQFYFKQLWNKVLKYLLTLVWIFETFWVLPLANPDYIFYVNFSILFCSWEEKKCQNLKCPLNPMNLTHSPKLFSSMIKWKYYFFFCLLSNPICTIYYVLPNCF